MALVCNNDVRLHPQTYSILYQVQQTVVSDHAAGEILFTNLPPLFVSAVGRRENDMLWAPYFMCDATWTMDRGGPDFSCFLITRACHDAYPFDQRFAPAYCEDCDYHRQLMLGGNGERIFSINLPYLHYASGTINSEPEKALAWAKRIEQSRAHYVRKWGGDVNHERFTIPFDAETDQDHVTNPELQALILGGSHAAIPESVAGDAVLGEGVDRAAP